MANDKVALMMLTTHCWLSWLLVGLNLPLHLGEARGSDGVQSYNILSLDGGGSRGVMETVILRQDMATTPFNDPQGCDGSHHHLAAGAGVSRVLHPS